MMASEEQLHTVREEARFVRTVSKGMYYKTGEDVTMELGILLHHAESILYLGPVQILKRNFGSTSIQRLVLFLMSKSTVNATFMESRFRSPRQLKTKPMSGWSYPEAGIVTWVSYDKENQKVFLKMLSKNLRKNKRKSIP